MVTKNKSPQLVASRSENLVGFTRSVAKISAAECGLIATGQFLNRAKLARRIWGTLNGFEAATGGWETRTTDSCFARMPERAKRF
jgi:hypothetical protein